VIVAPGRPFAIVIVGGIVSATIFTLLLLPLLYQLFSDERRMDRHRAQQE
jgi:cobalt-zinc-cadmium resistance protein CzcA